MSTARILRKAAPVTDNIIHRLSAAIRYESAAIQTSPLIEAARAAIHEIDRLQKENELLQEGVTAAYMRGQMEGKSDD